MNKRLLVIDGHAVIYRAFYAFPTLSDTTGQPLNAVYGFIRVLLKVIDNFQPEFVAVAFDHRRGKAKRVASFGGYKAQRKPMPDELISQIPIIKDVVKTFNIPQFELENFEADDILGTIAKKMRQEHQEVDNSHANEAAVLTTIVTGDKDILQLVKDGYTTVFIPGNRFTHDLEYNEALVEQKLGVKVSQIVDFKALMGDQSDNIPGVKGIGKKTAVKLLSEFGTLEKIYQQVEEIEKGVISTTHPVLKGAILRKIINDKEMAFLSKELATISLEAPVDFSLKQCILREYDKEKVLAMFSKYEFNSLKQLLPKTELELSVQKALF